MGVEAEDEPGVTTVVDLPASTAAVVPPSTGPAIALRLVDGYVAPEGWKLSGQLTIGAVLLDRDGVSIEVPFTGGPLLEPTDPCAQNYELVLVEEEREVRLALFELGPSEPEVIENYACVSAGKGWRLGATLDQPLGGRIVIDDQTEAPAPLIDLAEVLQPDYIPDGWVSYPPQAHGGQLERYYGHPEREPAFMYIFSAPVGEVFGLDTIRARDLVQIEEITVRSLPGIRVTSLEDGAVTLAWEEHGWVYQVHGYLVDPAELAAMAESMSN